MMDLISYYDCGKIFCFTEFHFSKELLSWLERIVMTILKETINKIFSISFTNLSLTFI